MSNWYRICCPVDFSETSRVAMEEAADIARRSGAELTLLHVFGAAGEGAAAARQVREGTEEELQRKLEGWKVEAERLSGGTVNAVVLGGAPPQEIVRLAREKGADLIVIGTHGRTGVRRLVIGSVAERVVREAGRPVLVVPPPAKA